MYLDIQVLPNTKIPTESVLIVLKENTEYTTSTLKNTGEQLRTIKMFSAMHQFSNEFIDIKPHNNLKSDIHNSLLV